jgi:hypothetical protein
MGGFSTNNTVQAGTHTFFKRTKFDFTSGNLDYLGQNLRVKAADGDNDWLIWKYNWDAGGDPDNIQGPLCGSWTNRATLDW